MGRDLNSDNYAGCWIDGIVDETLCLDDGNEDNYGFKPMTGIHCVIDPTLEEEPTEPTVNCVDEGNDDAWGVNLNDKNYGGCWIDGIVDETLCLDDGNEDNYGFKPMTGIHCVIDPTLEEEPTEPTVNCVDEGNDDAWGVNLNDKNYGGCWIDGIVDETLCLDDGDGDDQGINPETHISCDLPQ